MATFGNEKINLHELGHEHLPNAQDARPGSADLCLLSETPREDVLTHLTELEVEIEERRSRRWLFAETDVESAIDEVSSGPQASMGVCRMWMMVPEAPLEATEHGLSPKGDGWFVLNAREARWAHGQGRPAICRFEGEPHFPQLGIRLNVLAPAEPMAMYHWEADQEDFLVLSGEALLIVEGQERPLRQWDLVHCPAETKHVIVGAGDGPCVVVAVGARDRSTGSDWGAYGVDETALRHSAGLEQETADKVQAYARFPKREPTRYREGWLPG